MATDEWTVKEVLCHIVFWHENYAANYKAMANNQEPLLLDAPFYKLNKEGVLQLEKFSIENLIKRLQKAQNTLRIQIIEKKVPQMTYKKHGRVYATPQFLDLVSRHIATHTRQVRKAKESTPKPY